MPKYIECEALDNFFDREIRLYEPCPDKYDAAVELKSASHVIPAADVREIKRGRWSFDNIIFTDADGVSRSGMRGYKCSECDGFCIGESNYCPNCGARMEES